MDSLPSPNDAETLNENDAIIYVQTVVKLLSNFENEKIVSSLLSRLCNSYFDYQDFLDKITDVLIKKGFSKIAYEVFIFSNNPNNLKRDIIDDLFNILINYSDYSLSFAENILTSPLFNCLIDFCVKNQESFLSDKDNSVICSIVTVIHNVSRYPTNIISHDISTFKNVLLKSIEHNNTSKLGLISLLTLSYVIQEGESNLLDSGTNVIGILLNKIKTVNPVDHRSGGFTIKEMLNSLRCLSANDNVKKKIFSEDGLPLFLDILTGKYDEDEKELTLRIIWNMCFNPVIKQSLKKEFQLENVIEQFSETKNEKISENCNGILWLLNNKDEKKASSLSSYSRQADQLSHFKFDVFISYSREYKETISKIKDGINASNLRVWIDDEQMFGSTIEAMANGIENSRVFIVAMSKAYSESPNCRCEAEYAFKLRKPIVPVILQFKYKPMSWLGFIVGTKMYYEFSERRNPDESMSGIVRSIQQLKEDRPVLEELIEPQRTDSCMSAVEKSVIGVGEKIRKWKRNDVAKWLSESNCGNLQNKFRDLDGSLLEVLLKIRDSSPEYFNVCLKNEFSMKFVDVLKFHRALNSLNNIP